MAPIIRTEKLRKVYAVGKERVVALNNVDLSIEKGEFCCIVGQSGSGKSTLLNQLAGLEKPTSGKVYIGKHEISKMTENELAEFRQQHLGFIFQSYNLLPTMTAAENVALPLMFKGVDKKTRLARARKELKSMGLLGRANHLPTEMSGGQQQRIGVARAFAMDPGIILMDEPFSALDPITRSQLQDELVNLQAKLRKTIVFVTHDMDEAVKIADRICILHSGDILQYDTPENILKNPADGFVSEFVGSKRIWSSPELIKAKDIMIRTPKITYPDVPMLKCIEKMRIENVDSLLVVDENEHLLGIIRARSIHAAPDKSEPVYTVMKPAQATADPNENIVALLKKVNSNNISNVPVVDENKRLLGLITNSSLVTTMSQQFIDFEEGEA